MGVLTDVVTLLAERLPTECSSSTKNGNFQNISSSLLLSDHESLFTAMQENAISQLTVTGIYIAIYILYLLKPIS